MLYLFVNDGSDARLHDVAVQTVIAARQQTMLSLNMKFAVVVILMQQSCSSLDWELAKYWFSEATELLSPKEEHCEREAGTAVFMNVAEKISC